MLYNAKVIIPGLAIAVAAFTAPFWLNLGSPTYTYPELAVPAAKDGTQCVEPKEWMRAEHMTLLNTWRDQAIRYDHRTYIASNGKEWNISLQTTCLGCHTNKAEFCDKCHTANNVDPYCWNCHVEPKGNN